MASAPGTRSFAGAQSPFTKAAYSAGLKSRAVMQGKLPLDEKLLENFHHTEDAAHDTAAREVNMGKVLMIVVAMLISCAACAQSASPAQRAASPAQQATTTTPARDATMPDPAAQMQRDLNEMESLLNNMAAQTSFIRDTNMSILLNNNVRLWSILLRDLRMQADAQQKAARAPNQSAPK